VGVIKYRPNVVAPGMGAADCRGGPAAEAIAFEPFAAGGVCEIAGQGGVKANVQRPRKEKGRRDRMLPAGPTTW